MIESRWEDEPRERRFTPPEGGPADRSDREASLVGRTIGGRYRVSEILAMGGMGIVYGGVQERLRREVAIKVLATHASWARDQTAVERFVREAETAASISHPHGIVVHDFGLLDDGRPYLVMEKLVGLTFDAYRSMCGGQVDPKTVASMLAPAASMLEALHARGIVHRDVKPENLILADTPDGGQVVKVIDFGLVAVPDGQRLTQKGLIVGTPEYIAPETLVGHDLPDARADVYALAVVAFEMMTGALPFRGGTVAAMLAQKLRAEPLSLAVAGGRPYAVELEAVVAKGMARDPSRRYSTPTELTDALRRVSGTMEVTRPRSTTERPPAPSSAGSSEHAQAASPHSQTELLPAPGSAPRSGSNVWTFERDSIAMDLAALAALVDADPSAPTPAEPSTAASSREPSAILELFSGAPAPANAPRRAAPSRESIAVTNVWTAVRRQPQTEAAEHSHVRAAIPMTALDPFRRSFDAVPDPIEVPVSWWLRPAVLWPSIILGGTVMACSGVIAWWLATR